MSRTQQTWPAGELPVLLPLPIPPLGQRVGWWERVGYGLAHLGREVGAAARALWRAWKEGQTRW